MIIKKLIYALLFITICLGCKRDDEALDSYPTSPGGNKPDGSINIPWDTIPDENVSKSLI